MWNGSQERGGRPPKRAAGSGICDSKTSRRREEIGDLAKKNNGPVEYPAEPFAEGQRERLRVENVIVPHRQQRAQTPRAKTSQGGYQSLAG
jgi:hypothetical protein